jgi:hypothetical protein
MSKSLEVRPESRLNQQKPMLKKNVEGTQVQPDSINKIILMVGTFNQHEHIKKRLDFLAY